MSVSVSEPRYVRITLRHKITPGDAAANHLDGKVDDARLFVLVDKDETFMEMKYRIQQYRQTFNLPSSIEKICLRFRGSAVKDENKISESHMATGDELVAFLAPVS